jgi:replicative superfamily II helicase
MSKDDIGNVEYSAYVTFYGWMENLDEAQIENAYQIYSSSIIQKMIELRKILNVYKKLADKKGYPIQKEFEVFCDRIRHGVRADELLFKKEKGIGRDTCRSMFDYCRNVLSNDPWNVNGTILEQLIAIYDRYGEDALLNRHLMQITYIGKSRAEIILNVIKRFT